MPGREIMLTTAFFWPSDICIYTYIHTYIDTYIHAYIDTYIDTYIRTYLYMTARRVYILAYFRLDMTDSSFFEGYIGKL